MRITSPWVDMMVTSVLGSTQGALWNVLGMVHLPSVTLPLRSFVSIGLRRFAVLLALLVAGGFSASWAQSGLTPEPVGDIPGVPSPDPAAADLPAEYTIGPDDVLQVRVWREPDVSVDSLVVRADGKISVPLVGEVYATGLATRELEDILTAKFKRYINNPVVTVIAREIRSRRIYLIGGVGRPGSMPLVGGMTALDAIAEAGGLTDYAKAKKISILRDTPQGRMRIPFNYIDVLKGKDPGGDIPLQAGDRIVVPQ